MITILSTVVSILGFRLRRRASLELELTAQLVEQDERFSALFADLELVRIPLEKSEIAKDRTLREPLTLIRIPARNDTSAEYSYAQDDEKRAHIMQTGISAKGSMMWQVIDLKNNSSRWVERRALSGHRNCYVACRASRHPPPSALDPHIGGSFAASAA